MAATVQDFAAATNSAEHAHDEPINYEAILTGVVALASLFSNCVEAFGLINAQHKWEKTEQLLLAGLGVQQARLLIWGDVVGISSPSATVTDRAIPKHPSAAYPDLTEPTFFGARDLRLDQPDTRTQIESAISAIVDRSAGTSREEMMDKYGLKAPKKFTHEYMPALDTNRLEAFRERFELLKEVAETYAAINTRRQSSIVSSSWTIHDYAKFKGFIKLTQEKVDFLINLMDNKERVDRAMRMDIKSFGWHLSADRARVALDRSKLMLIQESCKDEYPEYVQACKEALANMDRERAENAADYNPYTSAQFAPLDRPSFAAPVPFAVGRTGRGSIAAGSGLTAAVASANGSTAPKDRKGSLLGSFFKRKSTSHIPKDNLASPMAQHDLDPPRSQSDAGPLRSSEEATTFTSPFSDPRASEEVEHNPAAVRSKSVGDILDAPINTDDEEGMRLRLEQMKTLDDDVKPLVVDAPPADPSAIDAQISRHDQYHGLGRQGTKTQW